MVNFQRKIIEFSALAQWRGVIRQTGKKLAVTNGCFDILHRGHITYLEQARNQADLLLVGVNSDHSVRALKGEGRPINTETDRAAVLAALEAVDAVCVFGEPQATHFLAVAQPDVYVKGGDYTIESLNREERAVVEEAGGRIVLIPFVPGKSTTGLIEKISRDLEKR